MAEGSSNRLVSNMEELVSKVEGIYSKKSGELDQVSGALSNIDRLVEVLARVELQQSAEQQLGDKITKLNTALERLNQPPDAASQEEDTNVQETLRKIIKGAKVTGKVLDIVAGGLSVMFDSITETVKSGNRQGAKTAPESVDLSSVLNPLGSILRGLVHSDNNEPAPSKQEEKLEN
ncbi:hypothetical protein Desru_0158 [Desulforamulus ruminis DSM 2154]|uniref:Uncharacterized protein n=1 Tax=Desulforamulus ruminis (strain ATCC 23193 / DSM 2154 / NCIMB 8452 / DL) TaxID=696281 RepID=F6DMP9_DESRL|nr:hypothetical protein [Desulforamulus ruminis]AEG58457.1 hypothetical protein Desru_0158 [Desulforamulus ruminis DSM 2154]